MNKKDFDGLTEEKLVCSECVSEEFLQGEITKEGHTGRCTYCGKKRKVITMEDFATKFEGAFERHYYRTSTEPNDYEYMLLKDRESSYDWDRHGDPVLDVIQEIGEVSVHIADDILEILGERHGDIDAYRMGEETEFASDSQYSPRRTDIAELHSGWTRFQFSVRTETRYFNSSAEQFLQEVFAELGEDGTHDGRKAIINGGPNTPLTSLFRARVFQQDATLKEALKRPDRELASPPFRLAKAGRMNAHGISLFYGATNRSVAIAEVRPPVGSRVMTGEFRLLRKVKLLDLEALRSLDVEGSYFDPRFLLRRQRAAFLRFLSEEMAKPVMPDDEHFSYLPTQVIADYLANSRFRLDGIIYPSVQGAQGMRNVVLFHEAAKVKEFTIDEGTEISASTSIDEDEDPSYWVFVSTDAEAAKKAKERKRHKPSVLLDDGDYRSETLELQPESLRIHHMRGIEYKCDELEVHRHTSAKDRLRQF